MNYDLQHSDLSTLLAEGHLVADETRRAFGQLSAEQINWKPNEVIVESTGAVDTRVTLRLDSCRPVGQPPLHRTLPPMIR